MKKGISTIFTVSLTVVIMLILAAGGWYYMIKQSEEAKKKSDDQIASLQDQIAELQKESSGSISAGLTTTGTSSTTGATPTTTGTPTNSANNSSFDTTGVFSLNNLQNASYLIPDFSSSLFSLKNGSYTSGITTFTLDTNVVGYFRENGIAKAAGVILKRTSGGTGVEKYLVLMNQKGSLPLSGGAVDLGDRVQVNSISLSDTSHLTTNYLGFGPNDPSCCPSLNTTKHYRWVSGTSLIE